MTLHSFLLLQENRVMIRKLRDLFWGSDDVDASASIYCDQVELGRLEKEIRAIEDEMALVENNLRSIQVTVILLSEGTESLLMETYDRDSNAPGDNFHWEIAHQEARKLLCNPLESALTRKEDIVSRLYQLQVHITFLRRTRDLLKDTVNSIADAAGVPTVAPLPPAPVEVLLLPELAP